MSYDSSRQAGTEPTQEMIDAVTEKICEAIGGGPEDGREPGEVALEIIELP